MRKRLIVCGAIIAVIIAVIVWRPLASRAKRTSASQTFTLKKADLLDSVLVSGTVISSNTENVYSKLANYPIKEIYFEVGDKVKAGDILAQIDTTSLELDIKQSELNIKNAEISLKNEESSNKYNLNSASSNVESALLELNNSQRNYDQIKKLCEVGASSQNELLQAETMLKKAQVAYNNAEASLANIKNKNTDATKNSIEIQKVTLEKQKKALNDAKIAASIDGTVTMANAKENGSAAGLLFVIEDTDNLVISTAIGEYDIGLINLGQEVIIKADSTGDKQFAGTVSKIAPTAIKDAGGNTLSSTNVLFDAEIELKEKDPLIKIGMNVRLTIILNEKKDVYSVPYDAVVTENDGSEWIYVLETEQKGRRIRNNITKIQVQTGMETDMYVEISSPELKEGMSVLTSPNSNGK